MNIIKAEVFHKTMKNVVEPYLASKGQELWFTRTEYQKIHCMKYEIKNAKGVIVISHGFTESAEKYMELVYYFLKENYHVYVPEHCGHGYSYRLTEDLCKVHVDDYHRYVEDFAYVAHYIKNQYSLPVYLYGHSMGSAIGALTAAKYPELFDKIILNSPMLRPATGKIPWSLVKLLSFFAVHLGFEEKYISGHQKYQGLEAFEDSCSISKERFDYYNKKKFETKAYQTSGATYGWMYQATKIYQSLMKNAYKKIDKPLILFQAEKDTIVSLPDQKIFIQKMIAQGNKNAKMLVVPKAKHEIYNSDDSTLEKYWNNLWKH